MALSEIGADGIWTIPAQRYKTKCANFVPLSKAALTLITAQPRIDGSKYVFSSHAGTPFSAFSWNKAALDRAVLAAMQKQANGTEVAPIPNWHLHDLRRTAKTLMARAGVRPDISERVLSHVIPGVEGVYDCYEYLREKADALTQLAALIDRIIHAPVDNVASLDEHRARGAA